MTSRSPALLPTIVVAQFFGTSLWFASNAVSDQLSVLWPGRESIVAWLTSSVQLGFIVGSLVFVILAISDRIRAHVLFAISAALGAVLNGLAIVFAEHFFVFIGLRFATGVCLAGVYPIGMKLAASHFRQGLGRALGLLVGGLVLGTAFPHLLRTFALPWRPVMGSASALALAAAVMVPLMAKEGPHTKRAQRVSLGHLRELVRHPDYVRASLGYFGHMWELYALWAFVPAALATIVAPEAVPGWSFAAIGAGAVGCAVGGMVASRVGGARVAFIFLACSGLMCLASPWLLGLGPWIALPVLIAWGVAVAGDSPQFSGVAAQAVPSDLVGTALTLMNAIGFSITIGSVWLLGQLGDSRVMFVALAPGPIVGCIAMLGLLRRRRAAAATGRA